MRLAEIAERSFRATSVWQASIDWHRVGRLYSDLNGADRAEVREPLLLNDRKQLHARQLQFLQIFVFRLGHDQCHTHGADGGGCRSSRAVKASSSRAYPKR